MKISIKFMLAVSAVALFTACGGGGGNPAPTLYGSLASKLNGVEAGVATKQKTQAAADALAINNCGSNCSVVLNFFDGQCVGTAYGTSGNTQLSWAVGATSREAADNAVLECIKNGGRFCSSYRGGCN